MLESAIEQSVVKLLSPSLIYTIFFIECSKFWLRLDVLIFDTNPGLSYSYSVHIPGSLYCTTVS